MSLYTTKEGRIFTQQKNPSGIFFWVTLLIQAIERVLYAQKFPGEKEQLNRVLQIAKESASAVAANPVNERQFWVLIDALSHIKRHLETGTDFENNPEAEALYREIASATQSLLATRQIDAQYPLKGNALPPANLADLNHQLAEALLHANPADIKAVVFDALRQPPEVALDRIVSHLSRLPSIIRFIVQHGASDAELQHIANYLAAIEQAKQSVQGPQEAIDLLTTYLDISQLALPRPNPAPVGKGPAADPSVDEPSRAEADKPSIAASEKILSQPGVAEGVVVEKGEEPDVIAEQGPAPAISAPEEPVPAVEEAPAPLPVKPSGAKTVDSEKRAQLVVEMFKELGPNQAIALLEKQVDRIFVGLTSKKNQELIDRLTAIQCGLGLVLVDNPSKAIEQAMQKFSERLQKFAQL